ncbi:MAG: hypothetical protein AAFX39_16505, partial [Pseudomonadota bacterium]
MALIWDSVGRLTVMVVTIGGELLEAPGAGLAVRGGRAGVDAEVRGAEAMPGPLGRTSACVSGVACCTTETSGPGPRVDLAA